jgi:hypothetical protein
VRAVAAWLDRLWFPASSPGRLAVLRILVGGFALWHLWARQRAFGVIARMAPDLYHPVGLATLHGPLDPAIFDWLVPITLGFGVLFVLGVRFRWTGPLFAVLFLWVMSYRNSWTMIYHSANLTVLHLLVLGFTPSANVLSGDALARRWGRGRAWTLGTWPLAPGDPDWRYGWPVQLMGAVTAATYWLAGAAKVAGPLGWGWASGAAMHSYIVRDGIRKELLGDGATAATFVVHEHGLLLAAMAILTLVLELGAPLAFVGRRLARLWAVLAWGMHAGILLVMGISFEYPLSGIAFASFFPLERVFERVPRTGQGPPAR